MADDAAATPARGRGRPPKAGGSAMPKAAASTAADGQPRKRGRPPKNGGPVTPKPVVLDANGQPRKRGRPPKNGIAAQSKSKTDAPRTASASAKKRGRPRKEASDGDGADASPSARGRPKKDADAKSNGNGAKGSTGTPGRGRGRPPANPLQKFLGSFALECAAVSDNWPDQCDTMDMAISASDLDPCGMIASFNLGIVEGTMLLALTQDELNAFHSKVEGGSESDSEEDAECDEPPAKRVKSTADEDSLRLYFKWKGRNTTDTEIHDGSRNVGTIDFLDSKTIQFKGIGSFPALGSQCEFTGTRYDKEPTTVPLPWSTFSDEAAQLANENRW
ncbi:hypothetical protein TMEN_7228 [Trichophyton mentagrophytes]|uniref:Uncharacterized protein n=2 Tax=Trichophyton interdigitale TaxID=101480 RepID=A0A9P4YK97_9EURO|nr:hypothetical protein H101_01916 [Trichophyton interdigitale H6]KAF3893574.1 hypothetical protein GY631_3595 [Trichophyton interdigitale]KDB21484.1 hypothetical protein H109_06578 [Trichophyton interdigitale MR816]GBF64512.1 hypothetical protein TMEN_7228 [Trichophyton mentagrophytes]KAF3897845.1 hypothetical protein GY632_2062 [Trichophyton interdigitale]